MTDDELKDLEPGDTVWFNHEARPLTVVSAQFVGPELLPMVEVEQFAGLFGSSTMRTTNPHGQP